MDQFYLLEMLENTWVIGGKVLNIQKARRAFFHYGSIGVFQGDISPLSSREVIESCVMPVLLYGSENWILMDDLLRRLDPKLFRLSWSREC